ncbi:MAG TPA: hypothetical protein VN923_04540, partial [Thermoanaerobaculia bacterium]|nr:hypothetical protein [Thermoanaerobaculia bacterium]
MTPRGALPAGHHFELVLDPTIIVAADTKTPATLPLRFELATRAAAEDGIGDLSDTAPLGNGAQATDSLQVGQLMLVTASNGELVAFDVADPTTATGFRRQSRLASPQIAARTLATDGHGRVFWSSLFGSRWSVQTLRLEDVRKAEAACSSVPEGATAVPCFVDVAGGTDVANTLGASSMSASEWLASFTLPSGTPMDLDVVVQDEKSAVLSPRALFDANSGKNWQEDSRTGVITFDVELTSTYKRTGDEAPWRENVCTLEYAHDRYQRATIDNLTTGERWSVDIENPWGGLGGGNGKAVVSGIRARQADRLQVRYNLRALGYLAVMGSGITVLDLNRGYRLPRTSLDISGRQCGRRLGVFEGEVTQFDPAACPAGSSQKPEGMSLVSSLAAHGETCTAGQTCRGESTLDVYSPLLRYGVVHAASKRDKPAALQSTDMAACIDSVQGQSSFLREVAVANDVEWWDNHLRGTLAGQFSFEAPSTPQAPQPPVLRRGDLAFATLGTAGTFVFDVSDRALGKEVVGLLRVKDHSAYRIQVDAASGLVFVGGTDVAATPPRPVVDVFELRHVAGAATVEGVANRRYEPRPIASLALPWATGRLGVDGATGLIYAWDQKEARPRAFPFTRPKFVFAGLLRPPGEDGATFQPVSQPTSYLVPLGVPMALTPAKETSERLANERKASAAFKVRVALPGVVGDTVTARVETLRVLPAEHLLGKADVGAAQAPPGGLGWPDHQVYVTLRRRGDARWEGSYNLYESDETVLLIADPRAAGGYRRQEISQS